MEISPCRISQAIWARLYFFHFNTLVSWGSKYYPILPTFCWHFWLRYPSRHCWSSCWVFFITNRKPKLSPQDRKCGSHCTKYHIIIERDLLIVLKPASEYQTSFDCTQKAMEWKITFVVPSVNHLEVGDCLFEDLSTQWLMPCTQTLSPCLHHHFGQEHLKTEKQPQCSSQHFKMIAQNKTTHFFCNANSQNNIELDNCSCWTKPDDLAVLNWMHYDPHKFGVCHNVDTNDCWVPLSQFTVSWSFNPLWLAWLWIQLENNQQLVKVEIIPSNQKGLQSKFAVCWCDENWQCSSFACQLSKLIAPLQLTVQKIVSATHVQFFVWSRRIGPDQWMKSENEFALSLNLCFVDQRKICLCHQFWQACQRFLQTKS